MIQNKDEHFNTVQDGKQAAESAKGDALGELRCECGRKVHGGDCPECDGEDSEQAEPRRQSKAERLAEYYEGRRDYQ